jgi:hypothetical protein
MVDASFPSRFGGGLRSKATRSHLEKLLNLTERLKIQGTPLRPREDFL